MNKGMLWYSNDPKTTLEAKIKDAAEYYRVKHLHNPTLCYINPTMMPAIEPGVKLELAGLEVRSSQSIMPNHFWLGVGIP